MMKSACDQDCGKITPTPLLGDWRGLMVKKGPVGMFDMGEIDMKFGDSNLTITYPNKTQDIYDVSTTGFGKITLKKGDETYQVVYNTLANLKHTIAMGLSSYGKTAPESFKQGMISTKAESLVMWKCSSYGNKTCNFNDEMAALRRQLTAVGKPAFGNDDCNKYADCHKCITATEGNIKCGWCLGDTLDYKGIGKTSYKCGGF